METQSGRQEDNRAESGTASISHTDARPSIWHDRDHSVAAAVNTAVFSVATILRAAYKLTDRHHIWIESDPQQPGARCVVFIRPKPNVAADAGLALGEFANELIDQRLREHLDQQFGPLRTIIAAQAFAEGNLLNPASEGDFQADSHGTGERR